MPLYEKNKTLRVAMLPIRRGIPAKRKGAFPPEAAVAVKNMAIDYLRSLEKEADIEVIDIDFINDEGVARDVAEADAIAEYMKEKKADAVFIIQCNFGCEEVAGRVCKLVNKPVILWGPRDPQIAKDGGRPLDTQCGLFATSRILRRYGIPYSYIENCDITDPVFKNDFYDFLAVVNVVKTFRDMRIGQISNRPKYFTTVMINENELMENFGIEVVPINIAMVKAKMDQIFETRPEQAQAALDDIKNRFDCSQTPDEEMLRNTACLKLALLDLVKEQNLSGLTMECWTLTLDAIHAIPCIAVGDLTDMGIPFGCETDVLGTIGSILAEAAVRFRESSFFGEFTVRSRDDDNTELMWHCGNAPYSLKDSASTAGLINARENFALKKGPITIVRFDSDRGQYYLFADEAESVEGTYTTGTYLWAKMDNWVKWEKKFIYGPYIHHTSIVYGHVKKILKEACRFISGVQYDSVED
ncbi:hypothetical protein [Anaerolentibacter hominis]|uniref:L-fucose/L-arabinose isomerase family protein n=1 Tax=Anaerolentibacter hominis TaxID=3079009 RepID=UPI0031B8886E